MTAPLPEVPTLLGWQQVRVSSTRVDYYRGTWLIRYWSDPEWAELVDKDGVIVAEGDDPRALATEAQS